MITTNLLSTLCKIFKPNHLRGKYKLNCKRVGVKETGVEKNYSNFIGLKLTEIKNDRIIFLRKKRQIYTSNNKYIT